MTIRFMTVNRYFRPVLLGLASLWLVVGIAIAPGQAALREDNPIAPPTTHSPRSTLVGFIDNMDLAYAEVMRVYEAGKDEPGWRYSLDLRRMTEDANEAIERAIETLDLSEVSPERRQDVGMESILMLKEILDRLALPDPSEIPGRDRVRDEAIDRWVVPYSEIAIQKIASGPNKDKFLFSSDTIERLSQSYAEVENFPYKPDSSVGFYRFYISKPGSIVPPKWAHLLPNWSNRILWDQTLWQWLLAFAVWGTVVLAMRRVYRRAHWIFARYKRSRTAWLELSFPSFALVCLSVSEYIVDEVINFTGLQLAFVTTTYAVLNFLSLTWLVFLIFNAIGSTLTESFQPNGSRLEAAMLRNGFRLLGAIAGATVITIGFTQLGFSVAPLLASLGAGSLALSLGMQAYIQDIVGGITIFADRSLEIGDLCEFGSVKGRVEDITLRTTSLRTLDRDLVIIPNSQISSLIVNYSRRDKYRFEHDMSFPLDTDRSVLESLMADLHRVLDDRGLIDTQVAIDSLTASEIRVKITASVPSANAERDSQLLTQVFLDIAELLAALPQSGLGSESSRLQPDTDAPAAD